MSEDEIQKIISKAIVDEYTENGKKWNKIFGSAGGYHINLAIAIAERLLASGQFISVKQVQNILEELRVYYRFKREKHLDSNLDGLAMDDELTLKGLQMLEAKLLEKGLLPKYQSEKE